MRRAAAVVGGTVAIVAGVVASAMPGTAAPPTGAGASAEQSTEHLGAVLVGGTEVPGPGDPDGFGLADVTVEGSEVCWRVTVTAVDPLTMGHIHAGPRGVAGPVVVGFEPIRRGCADVGTRLARFIRQHPGEFYVNLHNDEFPAGAVRGQLRD